MKVTKKSVSLILVLSLALGVAIGSTMAWFSDKTAPVTNVFTMGDINIELAESEGLDLKMIPGHTISKDPKAKVVAESEDCYLFVEIEESANLDTFIAYEIANGWQKLSENVYYMIFDSKDNTNPNVKGTEYSVLGTGQYPKEPQTGEVPVTWGVDQVLVKPEVTKAMMNSLTDTTRPTLTFTAYATQLYKNNTDHFTAAEAWAIAKPE